MIVQDTHGMNIDSGKSLSGMAHLHQSISNILTTPIGSRVMRREFGSRLFEMVDMAANSVGRLNLMAATADALARWEPRLRLQKITIDLSLSGSVDITITGKTRDDEQYRGVVTV